jgi:hypothetical protein
VLIGVRHNRDSQWPNTWVLLPGKAVAEQDRNKGWVLCHLPVCPLTGRRGGLVGGGMGGACMRLTMAAAQYLERS